MTKTFRPWDVDQAWLLPASVDDFVPPEHPAHLVREIVRGELDLTAILSAYDEERGQPPYHPTLMVGLFFYVFVHDAFDGSAERALPPHAAVRSVANR